MTGLRAGLLAIALVGIIAPFKIAQFILQRLYSPQVTGLPIPIAPSMVSYTIALAVAISICIVCFKLIKKDREPTDKQDGLDNSEELFY